jgi:hypothetical protein
MRAKQINEALGDLLKPKSKKELEIILAELKNELENTHIRDHAIEMIAYKTQKGFNDVSLDIAYYISENEFNEALMYILTEYLKEQGIVDES